MLCVERKTVRGQLVILRSSSKNGPFALGERLAEEEPGVHFGHEQDKGIGQERRSLTRTEQRQ